MRAIWSGSVSFGLVNIPVRMYNATEDRGLHFHLLSKDDHCRIRFARVCRESGKEIPYEDIVRGFEYADGEYVVLTDDDFKKADVRRTKTVDIDAFCDEKEIDAKLFRAPYFLEPGKGVQKPYALLREALRRSQKAAVGKFVLRQKEILCVLRADGKAIVLNELRFPDEVRSPEELNLPGAQVPAAEEKLALQLIEQLSKPFEPSRYRDEYTENLRTMIEQKARGERVVGRGEEPRPTRVADLVAMLQASLERERTSAR